MNYKILVFIMAISFIGYTYAARAYDLDGDGIIDAYSTGRFKADWNNDGIIDWRDPWVTEATVVRPQVYHDDWVVRDGWRGVGDWNGDGIVDWRDDWYVGGAQPWNGDWVRADWNRDGVIDWQDGWRRTNDFAVDAWDPTWRGNGWRGETVSVREVPAGTYNDTEWRGVEGPWTTHGWGGAWLGDWNGDGVVDWKDDWEWKNGVRSGSQLRRNGARRVGAPKATTTKTQTNGTSSKPASTTSTSTKPSTTTGTTSTTKPAASTTKTTGRR